MTLCKECKEQIIFDINHVWKHVNGSTDNHHKALPKYTVTSTPVSDSTGFAGEAENIKSVPAGKDVMKEAQAKMQAMKFLALNQLELNYRLAAITGLLSNAENFVKYPFEVNVQFVLSEADKIAKAAIGKWHSDMINESKIMMEGVE